MGKKSTESFVGSWNSRGWIDLDDLIWSSCHENLKLSGLVQGTVQKRKKALMRNIWSVLSWVSLQLVSYVIGMILAIQQNSLLLYCCDLQSCLFQNDVYFSLVYFVFFCKVDHFGCSWFGHWSNYYNVWLTEEVVYKNSYKN